MKFFLQKNFNFKRPKHRFYLYLGLFVLNFGFALEKHPLLSTVNFQFSILNS